MTSPAAEYDIAQATQDLARGQSRPITVALVIAAVFFAALGIKNLFQPNYVMAASAMVSATIGVLYARSFRYNLPRPMSDLTLVFVACVILILSAWERGVGGLFWAYPLILFFHLAAAPRYAILFNGAAIVISGTMATVMFDDETAYRVVVTLTVITALILIYTKILRMQQLHQGEQRRRLDLLLRCSNVGGYEWDAETGQAEFSPRLKEMLGYEDDEEFRQQRLETIIHPDDQARVRQAFEALSGGADLPGAVRQSPSMDFRMLRKDGATVWVHVDAIVIAGRDGRPSKFIASFLDITPLKSAEESTRAALERQQELNELRTRFVAMTSHEFRTPLATILSSAELLERYRDRMPEEEQAVVLASIGTGVQRMTHMLDRMLLISKAEANMLEFKPESVNLRQLCESVIEEVRLQQPEAGSRIVLDYGLDQDVGRYDEKLLRHIFDNLLANALKYSPRGGEVRFSIRRDGEYLVFEVADQGIGIPEEDLPNLFHTFHRGRNVGDIKGTGLGLSIVKISVELHNGSIEVHSRPGEGTRFIVRL